MTGRPLSIALLAAVTVAAAVAVAFPLAPSSAGATPDPSVPTWVFFRAPEIEGRDGADPALTPRSVARREKARRERERLGIAGELRAHGAPDTPPDPSRLATLEAAGARIRTVSRWLNAASVQADPDALAAIRGLPFVEEVRPVATLEPAEAAFSDVDDAGPSHPQLDPIGILEAHAMGYQGDGVVIGVLDSGFLLSHEALRHADVRAQRDFVQRDDDPSDDRARTPPDPPGSHNHGTQVLSLIAAARPGRMIGSAPRASFLLAKTERSGSETSAEEDNWVAGVEWAEAQGADVITASLSYTNWYRPPDLDGRSAVTTRMANLAWERGVLLLNSAGNAGPRPATLGAPADAPGTLTVGSTGLDRRIARSSSRGPTADGRTKPDVVAPGSGVLVASAGSVDRYHRGSGTSYATPLVAGLAALIVEAHPRWGPEAVREALVMSGDRADRPDNDYGWGIPNARRAILYPLLAGTIRDATTGQSIGNATVAWERAGGDRGGWAAPGDSPPVGETRTDAGGAYAIPNLPPGAYRLTVSAGGYLPRSLGPFDVPPNLEGIDAALAPAR
jgi:serine protease AprX